MFIFAAMKITWVTKAVLANHLGVERQVVHNWAKRGLIKTKFSDEIGMTLVEKISEKPTKTYETKKNISTQKPRK